MNCTGTFGSDQPANYPISYIQDVSAIYVTSVQFSLNVYYLGGTYPVSVAVDAYTCGDGSTIGTYAGSATFTGSVGMSSSLATFTFSSPFLVQDCGSGHRTVAFKMSSISVAGGVSTDLWADEVLANGSCFLERSTSSSNLTASPHSWVGVVMGTQ